ncbi:MAG TPA: helix-turn-helix domain-containing protein, partial [Candidatus Paceibacterota bacterium]
MIIREENALAHYGILRRSGRYPWGSGGTVTIRSRTFLETIDDLRRQGLTESEIAKGFHTPDHPFTTTNLRAAKSIAKNAVKQADIAQAQRLRDKGWSNSAIGRRMGRNESSVRALLDPGAKDKADILETTANMLKGAVDEKSYVDIGVGVERHLGISKEKLATAVARLQEEGYTVHPVKLEQLGTGKMTEFKVLAKPGVTQREVWLNRANIKQIREYSQDGGRSYFGILPPLSISSRRVAVRYAEDGGGDADGVIYVRPGKADLSLGGTHYAQVRIAVDGTHYLKGMAMYKDDLPEGVDLVFNTNKHNTGNKHDAMKPLKIDKGTGKIDEDNPFGAVIRQIGDKGPDGKVKKLTSVMNLVNDESDWETWSRSLSSQFLSKQSPSLAKTQLDMTLDRKKRELNEIMATTNPTVRRKLLDSFADGADS